MTKYLSIIFTLGVLYIPSVVLSQTVDSGLSPGLVNDSLSIANANKKRSKRNLSRTEAGTRNKLGHHLANLWQRNLDITASRPDRLNPRAGSVPGVGANQLKVGHPFLKLRGKNEVQVYVSVRSISPDAVSDLAESGLAIELVSTPLNLVQGWIFLDQLDKLATQGNVISVTRPSYASSRKGSVTTEGDSILKANKLRSRGLRGQGVRVGIISDGANNWTTARASGDLPSSITRYGGCTKQPSDPQNCAGAKTCNEGTAMAEIIHDIAPDAQIAVAAASTSAEFISRANQLANSFNADIIVDDLGFLAEPYFEDGLIAKSVQKMANRVLFVSAAGNSADGHYERIYTRQFGGNLHDFGRAQNSSSDIDLGVVVPAKTGLLTILQWNDSYFSPNTDYDLYLFNESGIETASAADQNNSNINALEGFCWYNASNSDVVRWITVERFSDSNSGSRRIEMLINSRGAQQYNDSAGSIFGHPAVPEVLAVGAINAGDSGHNSIAFYSSRGPSRVDFPTVKNRKKPDIVGIDGVRVTGTGGFFTPFFGTSAAAPHVAGIAAQLLRAKRSTPYLIRQAITQSAVDLGSTGFDSTFGYGRINAELALEMLGNPFNIAPIIYLLDES